MGNLVWHEYSRLVAVTASVCESFVFRRSPPPESPASLNKRVANPIVCALADICRYLLGRLLGPNLAQVFLGFRWRDVARPRRVAVSSPSMHALTLPPDRIGHYVGPRLVPPFLSC